MSKRLSYTLGVGIAIMDDRRPRYTQCVNSEVRRRNTLRKIIMSSPVVARVVVFTSRSG